MTTKVRNKPMNRFRWSHHHPVHKALVKTYNAVMRLVPFSIKYAIGQRQRQGKAPYSVVGDGAVVVQVGAPKDTLEAGRSRAMHLALRTAPHGRTIVVEPDSVSVGRFRELAAKHGLAHATVLHSGAWSSPITLTLHIDDAHPATNFTDGTADYDEADLKNFRVEEVPADSIDNILQKLGVEHVDLVSITTNGAEPEILTGMQRTMDAGLEYIALAVTG